MLSDGAVSRSSVRHITAALLIMAGLIGLATTALYWASVDDLRIQPGTLSQGYVHACALSENDDVVCWGGSSLNALDTNDRLFATHGPVRIDGIDSPAMVSAGRFMSCALLDSGQLSCWGATSSVIDRFPSAVPVNHEYTPFEDSVPNHPSLAAGIDDAIAVSLGQFSSCVVTASGTVECFGQAEPLHEIEGIDDAIAVSVGWSHACALRSAGTVACWGSNGDYELGTTARPETRWTPIDVAGLTDITEIAALTNETCAVDRQGSLFLLGPNMAGHTNSDGCARSERRPDGVRFVDLHGL